MFNKSYFVSLAQQKSGDLVPEEGWRPEQESDKESSVNWQHYMNKPHGPSPVAPFAGVTEMPDVGEEVNKLDIHPKQVEPTGGFADPTQGPVKREIEQGLVPGVPMGPSYGTMAPTGGWSSGY